MFVERARTECSSLTRIRTKTLSDWLTSGVLSWQEGFAPPDDEELEEGARGDQEEF